jgi:hypothetical protein
VPGIDAKVLARVQLGPALLSEEGTRRGTGDLAGDLGVEGLER